LPLNPEAAVLLNPEAALSLNPEAALPLDLEPAWPLNPETSLFASLRRCGYPIWVFCLSWRLAF
jgi:hypothetical protein